MEKIKSELLDKIMGIAPQSRVVVLPHFCIDNFIRFGGSFESLANDMRAVSERGGGNLSVTQSLHPGGKAANCALALASLGIRTHLIARTDMVGIRFMESFIPTKGMDISHVKTDGRLAFTTSLELEKSNIMISDPGSLSSFGPDQLTEDDDRLIEKANLVCLSDWGLNNSGTDLAQHVFTLARKNSKCTTFFDPGDPNPKGKNKVIDINRLVNSVFKTGMVDILSLNADEAVWYGKVDDPLLAAEFLGQWSRVDLHTDHYAQSFFMKKRSKKVPTFDIVPRTLTGAGDAWNAGDIYGHITGLSDELRLLMANATAAYYISNPEGIHPTLEELTEFIENTPLNQ
jgi:ribokinase